MNFDWLEDKRTRFVAQTLPSLLYLVGIFVGLATQIGYTSTALIAVIGAFFLWLIANRIVEKASPTPKSTVNSLQTPSSMRTRVTVQPTFHLVCEVGPHKVNVGDILSIPLKVKQGQRVKGHLEEVDGQLFDWYIADEKNMILLKNGQRDEFKSIQEGLDEKAYHVNRKIPYPARWYLLLDTYNKQNGRKVRVDFEPVADFWDS